MVDLMIALGKGKPMKKGKKMEEEMVDYDAEDVEEIDDMDLEDDMELDDEDMDDDMELDDDMYSEDEDESEQDMLLKDAFDSVKSGDFEGFKTAMKALMLQPMV